MRRIIKLNQVYTLKRGCESVFRKQSKRIALSMNPVFFQQSPAADDGSFANTLLGRFTGFQDADTYRESMQKPIVLNDATQQLQIKALFERLFVKEDIADIGGAINEAIEEDGLSQADGAKGYELYI